MLLAEEEREQHKLDRKIVAEEHWMRYGVTGRRKRNMLRVGNLQALRERRRTYRGNAGKRRRSLPDRLRRPARWSSRLSASASATTAVQSSMTSRSESSAATVLASSDLMAAARLR